MKGSFPRMLKTHEESSTEPQNDSSNEGILSKLNEDSNLEEQKLPQTLDTNS